MDLALLRTFLTVYRAGSFTRAGSVLGISQPTVTSQIRVLEQRVGMQLFQRLPRGVAPTTAAERIARQLAPHLDALEEISTHGLRNDNPLRRRLRLGGPADVMLGSVLPALTELVTAGLQLRVHFGASDELHAGLAAHRFDVAVVTSRPRGRSSVGTVLADQEYVLVGAERFGQDHPSRVISHSRGAVLDSCPLIDVAEDMPITSHYWAAVFDGSPPTNVSIIVPDVRGVLDCVRAGCGIAVLPRKLCVPALSRGEIVTLLEPEVPPIDTLFLAVRSDVAAEPHVTAVCDRLVDAARTW